MPKKKHSPHPVDIHVGERLRQLRVLSGKSQADIGEMLGISFQQIQKYERGSNRLSASKLYDISCALSVHPAYFFDGMGIDETDHNPPKTTRETLILIQQYHMLEDKAFRAAFLELLKTANQKALQ